ncbi:uncharacterized protein BX663DRAFT_265355 [Cokeromyces recurvatus]|uniref:uncharacterized protein n=1 Tax=Cokeromyces recurvatus TaxID=90255 RepID=UPI00221EDC20|nr:uncharacterized protein BX663DRAFT_265355 [Cokeromyces recurvatus]KAI7898203.1 hypothetical protein BX663DRAFT_265355 [Cokeromyces recurvatus]
MFAHLHFDTVEDSTIFYYAYYIKQQCLCLKLSNVIVKPTLTNKKPVIYDFSLINTAIVNNSLGSCICLDVNNTSLSVNETENNQSVNDSTDTIIEQKRRLSKQWEDDLKNSILNLENLIEKRVSEFNIWKKKLITLKKILFLFNTIIISVTCKANIRLSF